MHIFNKVVIKTGLIALFLLILYTENFTQPLSYYFRHFNNNQYNPNLKSDSRSSDIVYTDNYDGTRNEVTYGLNNLILDVSDEKRELYQRF
jgi:hypothetical protein